MLQDDSYDSDQANIFAAELIVMVAADQTMRFAYERGDGEWDETIDIRHTARLKEIIATIGWPTITIVGEKASLAAWMLAQHADADPSFQADCLQYMKAAAKDIDQRYIAYLEDRVRIHAGQRQLYGTQFQSKNGQWVPAPIAEEDTVDQRRVVLGLEPLRESIDQMQQRSVRG